MKDRVNRRRFMQTTSSAIAASALASPSSPVSAQSAGPLRVHVSGGDLGRAKVEAYLKPFQAETGISVTPMFDDSSLAQVELMVNTKNITLDVVVLAQNSATIAASKGLLEQIDYSIYQQDELAGIRDFCKAPFAVGTLMYSVAMVYNTKKFPADRPRPTSWAEFWDVQKFPGVRALRTGQTGAEGPWEEALLADGVPADAIYPMDIDRIFSSLDKIKSHIRRWYATGSEIQQILRDGAAEIMSSYDGRAQALIDQGAPLEINRNQAKLIADFWGIPKGGANVKSAQKFIEFASRADRQAAFAKLIAYGPTNVNAFRLLPQDLARKLASHPDYLGRSVLMNAKWYGEAGSDGIANTVRLRERWNDWILR